jgi:hypothetical protein
MKALTLGVAEERDTPECQSGVARRIPPKNPNPEPSQIWEVANRLKALLAAGLREILCNFSVVCLNAP